MSYPVRLSCFRGTAAVWLLCAACLAPSAFAQSAGEKPAAERAFVDALLGKMTLEEKIGQMSQRSWKDTDPAKRDGLAKAGLGSYLFVNSLDEMNRLQHLAVEQSRLHIPMLYGFDVVHGYRTIYPVPLALASSWDPGMVEHVQRMAAREASASGVRWAFAPMVDIARDPRWGRIMEGAGEDPYLGSQMAAAQVRGFQGKSLAEPDSILACVKHFAGYGAAAGGRDYDQSDISDEQLYNTYLPPFHAAEQAGAASFMTAYMDLNGVPAAGNRWLLEDVLRGQWGFQGFVVSDWDAVKSLVTHGFAANETDAAARAANAGLDMEMTSHVFQDHLAEDVKSGKVSMATVDAAVRRLLEAKYELGLFDHPYTDPARAGRELLSAEQRQAAREAAQRSAVLLRNEGGLLPLSRSVRSVAVVGAMADSKPDTMGSWSLAGRQQDAVTLLAGIRAKLGSGVDVRFAKGVEVERTDESIFDGQFPPARPTLTTEAQKTAAFSQALDTVRSADVTVLVLGEAQNMNGEHASRSSLSLPGKQQELLEAVVATGKPVVLVLLGGRPMDITWAAAHVPSILLAWYPGTEGGNAVADLLFGDAVPGGKLPVSWPRNAGQVPLFYNHTLGQSPQDRNAMYWDQTSAPLYPFGYGLSYSPVSVSGLQVSGAEVRPGGTLTASVELHNTGTHDADQTVELYTHQRAGSASRPVKELKGFVRVRLKAGESRRVSLPLRADDLKYWSPATHTWVLEPGLFDMWVGDSSATGEHATFSVLQ